jgi:L-asparaginase/Glu-tRNA(Gln) amidotransferase subunit D
VAANNLSPQKAAILLQLALTGNVRQEYLERLFLQY